jgi:hypothetical protein
MKRTPLTDLERSIVAKLSLASFPPATASKRFARDLAAGYVKELSSKGRKFLAYVVHRFRRQYMLTDAEQRWVNGWLNAEIGSEGRFAPVQSVRAAAMRDVDDARIESLQMVLDFERKG